MKWNKVYNIFQLKYLSSMILVLLLLFNMLFTKNFISSVTVTNLITQSTKIILLSLGMTLVIATSGIDISVGSAMGLAAIISAIFLKSGKPLGIIFSLLVILIFGLISGFLITRFKLLPMVVTLSMFYIMRGVAKGISVRGTVSYSYPKLTNFFINPVLGNLPIHFFIIILSIISMFILVNRTRFGIYVELYGNNPIAAKICGINTSLLLIGCYMISMFFAWVSGNVEMIMVSSADPSKIGLDLEIDAIAATLIGGTPVTGGTPNIIGSVSGAILLQLITMMTNMHNVPYSFSLIVKAFIILLALFIGQFGKRK